MVDRMPNFFDADTSMFNTAEEMKVARLIGEEIDNPKATFRKIETIFEERISLLGKKLYDLRKLFDMQTKDMTDGDGGLEALENELYSDIKKDIAFMHDKIEDLDSEGLMLQKQITTLKKEKVDMISQINSLNSRLDDLEKDLGINIAMKRSKKK